MAKVQVDRYVKVVHRNDNNGNNYFATVLYSENPDTKPEWRTHKQFNLGYETGNRAQAELYAYKLAKYLECRVVV